MGMESELESAEDMRSEDPLAERLADGDPEAPGELVERHHPELHRYGPALSILANFRATRLLAHACLEMFSRHRPLLSGM
jgi:hypothetical protein